MCPFSRAVGETVVDEMFLKMRDERIDEDMMHDAIPKTRCEYLSNFRVSNDETVIPIRFVCSIIQ